MREHGFSTNRSARGLSSGRTGMIGLTLPLVARRLLRADAERRGRGAVRERHAHRARPTLHEHDREVSLLERLMRGTTDGAILMLPEESADELELLQLQGFPFVVVDPREPPPDGIPASSAMHAAGAKQATEHLLALGHRRIGAIAGTRGLVRDRGAPASASAPRSPRAGILPDPELDRLLRLARSSGGTHGRRASCSRSPIRRPRSSASTTTSRSARCTPRASAACACRRTCRSSASTTPSSAVIVTPR